MLCEQVNQAAFRLTDVQRKAERRGDAINEVTESTGKGVGDEIRTMVGACEDSAVGKCSSVERSRGMKRLGDEVREETVDQVVTQVVGSFELERDRLVKMCEVKGSDWNRGKAHRMARWMGWMERWWAAENKRRATPRWSKGKDQTRDPRNVPWQERCG